MAVKYTTATKVKTLLADRVHNAISDAEIEVWIEEAEGIIDCWLKQGSGTGSETLTFSASKKPHLVLELAATMVAASMLLATSSPSFVTMDQALLLQETIIYWYEEAKKMLTEQEYSDFILEQ